MKVGLFGCGAYGMALSSIMIDNHCDITMWTKFEDEKKNLEETRKNEKTIFTDKKQDGFFICKLHKK